MSARVQGSEKLAFPHADHGIPENVRVKKVHLDAVELCKCRGTCCFLFELIYGFFDCAIDIQAKPIEAHFANGFVGHLVEKPLVEIGDQFVGPLDVQTFNCFKVIWHPCE